MTETVKKQEKKTFKQSMEGIMSSVHQDMVADDSITPRYYYYDNGILTLLKVKGETRNTQIKTTGKIKATGYIYVDIDGNIILDYLCTKKYCGYNKEDNSTIIIINNNGENNQIDIEQPLLTLKGSEHIYLGIGERYIEAGVEAKTKYGKDLSDFVVTVIEKDGKTVTSVDTNKIGNYVITYSVTYQGTTVKVTRNISVKEERPQIQITEASDKYVKSKNVTINIKASEGSVVNNFVYRINNGKEKTIMGTSTSITLDTTGEYQIKVEATDSKGRRNTQTSGIYKIDTIAPVIELPSLTTLKITEVGGYNPLDEVTITDNIKLMETSIEGSLNASLGTQTLTIIARDEAGNETRKNRNFEVITAQGPILNLSTVRTDGWVKGVNVTATATTTTTISSFTYEVIKNNVSEGKKNGIISGNSGIIDIPLTSDGTYTITLTASDEYSNQSTITSGTYSIDNTPPTSPTMSFVFGSWDPYTNGTWTNQDIYAGRTISSPGPTGSIDTTSGIWKYQISNDNTTWEDFNYSPTGIYYMGTNGIHNKYFRAVDYAGNVSNSIIRTAKIDKTVPNNVTITGTSTSFDNNGSNMNITVTGQDNDSGIAKYEIYYGTSSSSLKLATTISSTSQTATTTLTSLLSDTIYYIKTIAYDTAGNSTNSNVISVKTCVQVKVNNYTGISAGGVNTVIQYPSSTSKPTTLEIEPVAKGDLSSGILIMKKIKPGDTISISYSVTRYGSYYMDVADNQHAGTYSLIETNPTTSQNGVTRDKTFTAVQNTDFYWVYLSKTDSTSTNQYGTMSIYSITINGEKVL